MQRAGSASDAGTPGAQPRASRGRARIAAAAVALLAVALGALCLPASRPAEAAADRPNVVVVLLDDLDTVLSPLWQALPKTTALLRTRGVTFTNAFAPTPSCCPARTSILTGELAHNHGVLDRKSVV